MKSGWPISSFEHHHVSVDVALFWYDGGDSNLVLCWKKCYTWSILLKLQEARKLIIIMSNKQLVVIAVFTRGLGPYFCRNHCTGLKIRIWTVGFPSNLMLCVTLVRLDLKWRGRWGPSSNFKRRMFSTLNFFFGTSEHTIRGMTVYAGKFNSMMGIWLHDCKESDMVGLFDGNSHKVSWTSILTCGAKFL